MPRIEEMAAAPGPGSVAAPHDALGKDQFLQLLVAQISHQDPLQPLDDKDLIAQLAQFTSVEQAIETNHRLAALQGMTATQDRTNMASLIGKHVVAQGDTVQWDPSGAAPQVQFHLPAAAQDVTVRVVDGAGRLVRTLQAGSTPAGPASVPWDGRGEHGEAVPPGGYRVEVQARDAQGHPLTAVTRIEGTVTGVAFDERGAAILVGPTRLRPPDVVQIGSNDSPL